MKAIRNSPEWMSASMDKFGNPIKGKKPKMQETIIPFSGMSGNFQVHAKGYVSGVGTVEARQGKGAQTLYVNVGNVRNVQDVENQARHIHATMSKSAN